MDFQNPSGPPKPIIPTSKIHGANAILPQCRSTHDAWLDRDIQIGVFENTNWMLFKNLGDGDELGVSSSVQTLVRLVHASPNDLTVVDEDTANGCFVMREGKFGLQCISFEFKFVDFEAGGTYHFYCFPHRPLMDCSVPRWRFHCFNVLLLRMYLMKRRCTIHDRASKKSK